MKAKFFSNRWFLAAAGVVSVLMIAYVSALGNVQAYSSLQKMLWVMFAGTGIAVGSIFGKQNPSVPYIKVIRLVPMPYVIAVFYTVVVRVIGGDEMGIIPQAISTTCFVIVDILMVIALIDLFHEKAVDLFFYALIVSHFVSLLFAIRDLGIEGVVAYLGGDETHLGYFEMHDIGVAVVPFILYYIFKLHFIKKKNRKLYVRLLVLFGILFLCGKRSGMLACAFGIAAIFFFVDRNNKLRNRQFARILLLSAFVFSYFYVCVIKLGILKMVCNLLGINTMGRVEVYAWFEDQYNLTPLYFGEGFQYIRRYMECGKGDWLVNAFHYLHNSILQIYIETGFWGFIMWFGFLLVWIPKKVRSIYGSNGYTFYAILMAATVLMFAVDNVLTYPLYQVSLFMALYGGLNDAVNSGQRLCSHMQEKVSL